MHRVSPKGSFNAVVLAILMPSKVLGLLFIAHFMARKLIWLSFNLAVFRSGIYMSADQTGEVRIEYLG